MARKPNNTVYITIVLVWLTLSAASVLLAAITWAQLSKNLSTAENAVAVNEQLNASLKSLLDAETAQRGFTITGDDSFLAPLNDGRNNLSPQFERLAELVRQDPSMLKKIMDMRALAELILNYQTEVVAARKKDGFKKAGEIVAAGQGRKMMDEFRADVLEVSVMHANLLSGGGGDARAQLKRATLTSLIAGGVGIGAGLFAFWLSREMLRHRERERQLVEARLAAERNSREKTVFLANMSHEIRTPMNAILGFSELLDGELKEPRLRQYLHSIRSSADSLLQLINDILDMSKVEAGAMVLHPEPMDAREICEFLRAAFAEPAARKGVKLECRATDDLPQALLIDRIRLRQILVNLVGNAVKFTDEGSIHVRVLGEKGLNGSHITLLIEVQDTGVGIPQDKLDAVFKPFVQAGTHRDKERQGSGLGLSIVQRLTEMMGGTVTAASVEGQGSVFSLRFPNIPVSARLAASAKAEIQRDANFNDLRPARLLVVDDNQTNCRLVEGMFAGSHHLLQFASNGQEAVTKARKLRPDIILMDIRMPVMDGREALAQIRRITGLELIPVLAVTASSLKADEEDLKQRFNGYVRKPFSRRELFEELAQFLPREVRCEPANGAPVEETASFYSPVSGKLLAELRRMRLEDWPGVRDSLAINESKAFAQKLETLGDRWSCQLLQVYARGVRRHAENYAVIELENQLREYGPLVARLEQNPG